MTINELMTKIKDPGSMTKAGLITVVGSVLVQCKVTVFLFFLEDFTSDI